MKTPGEKIRTIGIISLGVVFVIYAIFKTWAFFVGPQLTVLSPQNGDTIATTTEIVGTAKNITSLFLNNRPIFTDEKGNFREKLILPSGYNIIELKADDRFNRTVKKYLELFLKDK